MVRVPPETKAFCLSEDVVEVRVLAARFAKVDARVHPLELLPELFWRDGRDALHDVCLPVPVEADPRRAVLLQLRFKLAQALEPRHQRDLLQEVAELDSLAFAHELGVRPCALECLARFDLPEEFGDFLCLRCADLQKFRSHVLQE